MEFHAPLLSVLLLIPQLGVAAPVAKAPGTKPTPAKKTPALKVSIEPAAKVILERAAKLYGATPKWSAQIDHTGPLDSSVAKVNIAFVRPNLLKVEYRHNTTATLEMVDGKTFSSSLKDPDLGTRSKQVGQMHSLPQHLVSAGIAGVGDVLSLLIQGRSGMEGADLKKLTEGGTSFTLKRLPNVFWKGISCQRVVWEKHLKAEDEEFEPTVIKDEHWFTPEGKLVRTIAMEDGDAWKSDITSQDFSPVFTDKTFVFVAPPSKPGKMFR